MFYKNKKKFDYYIYFHYLFFYKLSTYRIKFIRTFLIRNSNYDKRYKFIFIINYNNKFFLKIFFINIQVLFFY